MSQFPNQQDGFQTPLQPTPMPPAPGNEPGKGLAIASLILGIAGVVFSWMMGFGGLPSLIGLILAIVAKKKGFSGGIATAGLIISIIGIVLNGIIIFVVCAGFFLYELSYWM